MEKKQKVISYIAMIVTCVIFGTLGIYRKQIPLSSPMLACIRGLIGSLFLFLIIKIMGKKAFEKIDKKTLILFILTGCAIGSNWMTMFESFKLTTVSVCTLCVYMEPTIVILVSPLIFKEKLTLKKIICAVISFVGIFLVSGVLDGKALGKDDILGIVFGLATAVLYACAVILSKMTPTEKHMQKTMIELFVASVVCIPYLIVTRDFGTLTLNTWQIICVIIVGIVNTGVAYALFMFSMNKLSAQSVSVLGYIDPASALILSAIFLNERLSYLGLIGAVLIIGSAIISELNLGQIFKKKEEKVLVEEPILEENITK